MIQEILKYLNRYRVHDFTDKLNSEITVYMLFFMGTLVTTKTYFLSPIQCFVTNSPSGTNLEVYISHYCWAAGTSFFGEKESIPISTGWDKHRTISKSFLL